VKKPCLQLTNTKSMWPHPQFSRLAGSGLLPDLAWREIARKLRLSGRELQIVRGVFDNHTEHAIAAGYGIADCTVHTHLDRLYSKLAVTTRVGLVLRVVEAFLDLKPRPVSAGGMHPAPAMPPA